MLPDTRIHEHYNVTHTTNHAAWETFFKDGLRSIFAFIDIQGLALIMQTCKHWRTLVDGLKSRESTIDPLEFFELELLFQSPLKRHIAHIFHNGDMKFGQISKVAKYMPHVKTLEFILGEVRDYRGPLPQFPPALTDLTAHCDPTHRSSQRLFAHALPWAPSIVSLSLYNMEMNNFPHSVLTELPKLRRLSIWCGSNPNWPETFQRILWTLSLEYLSLNHRLRAGIDWTLPTPESRLCGTLKEWSFHDESISLDVFKNLLNLGLKLESMNGTLDFSCVPLLSKFPLKRMKFHLHPFEEHSPDVVLDMMKGFGEQIEELETTFLPELSSQQLLQLFTPMRNLRILRYFFSLSLEFLKFTPALEELDMWCGQDLPVSDLHAYLPLVSGLRLLILVGVGKKDSESDRCKVEPSSQAEIKEGLYHLLHPAKFTKLTTLWIEGYTHANGETWEIESHEQLEFLYPSFHPPQPPSPADSDSETMEDGAKTEQKMVKV